MPVCRCAIGLRRKEALYPYLILFIADRSTGSLATLLSGNQNRVLAMHQHHNPHTRGPGSPRTSGPQSTYPYMPHQAMNHTYPTSAPASYPATHPTYTHPTPRVTPQARVASNLHQVTYHATARMAPTMTAPTPTYTSQTANWRDSQEGRDAAKSENRKLAVFMGIFGVWVLAWCIFIGYYIMLGT